VSTESIVVEDPSEQIENQEAVVEEQAKQPAPEPEIPEKFRGKSAIEIIDLYKNLESDYGRRANEIGHLRKLTDELLGFARDTSVRKKADNQEAPKPITADDLINDPQGTITAAAKRVADERTAQAEARIAYVEASLAEQAFEKRHPGFKSKMEDQKFLDWVASSEYRKRLALGAYQNDFQAADELFTLHEEYERAAPAGQKQDSVASARAAGLAKSGGSSANGAVPKSGGDGKKVYSRAELINLRITNPEEFDRRFETEFQAAYAEGRVR